MERTIIYRLDYWVGRSPCRSKVFRHEDDAALYRREKTTASRWDVMPIPVDPNDRIGALLLEEALKNSLALAGR